jgi:hypothetical protein
LFWAVPGVDSMRCARCGRRERRLRDARGPDGRLVFGWCGECLSEVNLRALGLLAPEAPAAIAPPRPPALPHLGPMAGDERAAGFRGLGALLVTWGLLLELVGAGSWLGLGRPDDGFGPTRISRVQIFSVAGAVLAILGAWIGLATLDRGERKRTIARAVEAAAVGLGLCVLVVGIAFHDPRRDPWVVGAVLLAVVASRAARLWSRPRDPRVRPLPRG